MAHFLFVKKIYLLFWDRVDDYKDTATGRTA